MKKRILDKIQQMDENELLQVGKNLKIAELKLDEKASSVITEEILRRFNDFNNG